MEDKKNKIYDHFCAENAKYWPENHRQKNPQKNILVEGFFGESGPNYVMRVGTVVKAIEEISDYNFIVLMHNSAVEANKIKIWNSFGLNNFIGVDEIYRQFSLLKKLQVTSLANCYFFASKLLFFLKKSDFFLRLKFNCVVIGDLLYDEIIKENEYQKDITKKSYTIKKITSEHKKFFQRAFKFFFVSRFIYEKYKPDYFITTHTQYITYGMTGRYLASNGSVVIETTDDILFIHDDPKYFPPKFHHEVKRMIKNILEKRENEGEKLTIIETELRKRFAGKLEQIDVQMAYTNKQNYSEESLREKLGIKNYKPFVFIFAHIFSDAPQGLSDGGLFADYYQWLKETLEFVKNQKSINWIVKPHPSSKTYGEVGEVEKIVAAVSSKESTVFTCPSDFNTNSVINCAKAIVTAQGTVGLEFSCMGIPIIITSKPFYSGFGFTHEPRSRREYFEQLQNIAQLQPLNAQQIKAARLVYSSFAEIQNKDFSFIDTKIKDLTWGASGKQDILQAFELMTKRLEKIDPKKTELYQQIQKYFAKKN
jgi:hypothetical protein